jgi:plastocyanin
MAHLRFYCVALLLFCLMISLSSQAADKKVRGCLKVENGSYSVYDGDDSNTYLLQGNTARLNALGGKEIEASGEDKPVKAGVHRLQVKDYKQIGNCTAALNSLVRPSDRNTKQGEPVVPIAGKTGVVADSIAVTTTASVGQTTPPVDVNRSKIKNPPASAAGAPPVPEQIMQNPDAANRNAIAADRAEVGRSEGTLGASNQIGGDVCQSNGNVHPAAVVRMQNDSYLPQRVTITAGQAVEWRNTTTSPHTVTLDPSHAINGKDVAFPANAQPFNSGEIPGSDKCVHTFDVPGTYRYFCTQHEGDGMVGEVVVRPK